MKKSRSKKTCYCHANESAVAKCLSCGKLLCLQCTNELANKTYCPDCTTLIIKEAVNVVFIQSEGIGIERRKYARVNLLYPVEIDNSDSTEVYGKGTIISLSIGDAGILMDHGLKENTLVRVKLQCPERDAILSLQGGIVRIQKIGEKYFTAVTFMNLGNDFEKLKEFIDNRLKKRYIKINNKISFV